MWIEAIASSAITETIIYIVSLSLIGWLSIQLGHLCYHFYSNVERWRDASIERSLLRVFLSVTGLVIWSGIAIAQMITNWFDFPVLVISLFFGVTIALAFSVVSLIEVMQSPDDER